MGYLGLILIALSCFWPGSLPPFFRDIWHAQIFALFVFGTILICQKLYKIHWSIMIPFALGSYSAFSLYFYPEIVMQGFGIATQAAYGSLVLGSYLFMAFCTLPFLVIKDVSFQFEVGFRFIGFISSLVMITTYLLHSPHNGFWAQSFLENNSMDACFVAVTLPMVFWTAKPRSPVLIIPMVIAIILSGSVTAQAALALEIALYWCLRFESKLKLILVPLLVTAVSAVIYYKWSWKFEGGDGRFHIWTLAWNFWSKEANIWLGTGMGSFQMYGPGLLLQQVPFGSKIDLWIWMHSDWFQVLFELGIVGLTSVVVMLSCALWRIRNSPIRITTFFGYLFVALTQMPVRHTLFALLGAFLIFMSFDMPPDFQYEKTDH